MAVVFKNGDRLTGTMLNAVPDHVTLASEVAGTLTISTDKIESLSVDKPAVVIGGTLRENPFYAPPDQLIEELRNRARDPAR